MISILEGKVAQVLPIQNGVSKQGNQWELRSYVIETNEKYPKKVYVETLKQLDYAVGDYVKLGVEIESREYNGKWYTQVRIIGNLGNDNRLIPTTAPATTQPSATEEEKVLMVDAAQANEQSTDLPF